MYTGCMGDDGETEGSLIFFFFSLSKMTITVFFTVIY